jgi:hypothetical protein
MDVRTLSSQVTGMLAYIDEIVIAHPFVNANGTRPEFSPVLRPEIYREQTLREVYMLMILEPWIAEGRVHLIPDPLDYDSGFMEEIFTISKDRGASFKLGPIDEARSQALMLDDHKRAIARLPTASLKSYIKRHMASADAPMTDNEVELIATYLKEEQKQDPLSLMDPPNSTGQGGEFRMFKCFAREAGLYLATLTGSFVYTDSDSQWSRLHESDGVHQYVPDPNAEQATRLLGDIQIHVPAETYEFLVEPAPASEIRTFLRRAVVAAKGEGSIEFGAYEAAPETNASPSEASIKYRLRASVPLNGFQRTDVARLVLTFGRTEDKAPVRLALFLEPITDD